MRRWLFNIVTAASLLLLVATIGLWIHSYFAFDTASLSLPQFGDVTADYSVFVASGRGGIRLEFISRGDFVNGVLLPQVRSPWQLRCGSYVPPFYPVELNPKNPIFHGFSFHGFESLTYRHEVPKGLGSGGGILYQTYLLAPIWAWAILWAIFPLIYWTIIRKRRRIAARAAKGLCLVCGYDLRSHSPGQKCPECGTPIPAKPVGT